MLNNLRSPNGRDPQEETSINEQKNMNTDQRSSAEKLWERIMHLGLGEVTLRVLTAVVSVLLVVFVVWVMNKFYLSAQAGKGGEYTPTPTTSAASPLLAVNANNSDPVLYSSFGISRLAQPHTDQPAKQRDEIITYTIQEGDTLFGIAEKFGLQPETLLWSNRHILGDNPENIYPGVEILIPPIDGAIYKWNTGDGLNGVAKFYNVTTDVILDWPGNKLDRNTIGDLSLPNIPDGTFVFVPGGKGEFTDWLPKYTREKPAISSISGSACGAITSGYIGYGNFVWPTTERYLSGYDYSPSTNHRGIDIAGKLGNPIYAVDAGVIVYSNWNEHGYGNLIVVDHGNGWQSVYAHLSEFAKYCGDNVDQGEIIGYMGSTGNSTGPHLHFELRNETYGAVNPWDFLQ
jgi:murein DD-endopeptidase MepM/ murein hydrolase activator NlpD